MGVVKIIINSMDLEDYLLMKWAQANKNMSAYDRVNYNLSSYLVSNYGHELIPVRGWDYVRRALERQWKNCELRLGVNQEKE